jgi:hypothetical protein
MTVAAEIMFASPVVFAAADIVPRLIKIASPGALGR